jgi:ubiquinone/menaquinone biosynthesis C-methylase UbiE
MSEHKQQVVEQFSQQAIPFSNAPSLRDQAALSRLVQASDAGSGDTVLDVACGPGLVVRAFAEVAARVTGVDLTPAMVERAREHTQGLQNVELVCGDVEQLPFADATFSIVVSRLAFHHFPHPGRVLAEMKRVCKPGGRVVIADVLGDTDPRVAAAFHALEMQRDPSHSRMLPLSELDALFDTAGLRRRPTLHSQLDFELDSLVARSFPPNISRAQLKQLYLDRFDDDGLGLGLRRTDQGIEGRYKFAIIVSER